MFVDGKKIKHLSIKRNRKSACILVTSKHILMKRTKEQKIFNSSLQIFKIKAKVNYKANMRASNNFYIFATVITSMLKKYKPTIMFFIHMHIYV